MGTPTRTEDDRTTAEMDRRAEKRGTPYTALDTSAPATLKQIASQRMIVVNAADALYSSALKAKRFAKSRNAMAPSPEAAAVATMAAELLTLISGFGEAVDALADADLKARDEAAVPR